MIGPYAESVLSQLMEAGRREQRRRRRRVRSAIAATVAAVTGSVVLLLPNPAAADVHVRIRDGIVEVRLTDRDATVDDVVEAFEDKGLTVVVEEAATGPASVGDFVLVEMLNGDPGQIDAPAVDGSFSTFRVREGWVGQLRVTLGRAAQPAEPYLRVTDPFAPEEALHCAGVYGTSLQSVGRDVDRFDVLVFLGPDGSLGGHASLADAAALHPDWVVTAGAALSDQDIQLTAEPVQERNDRC